MVYLVEFQYEIANIESNVLNQVVTPRDPHLTPLDQVTFRFKAKVKNVRVYGMQYTHDRLVLLKTQKLRAKPLGCYGACVHAYRTISLESCN